MHGSVTADKINCLLRMMSEYDGSSIIYSYIIGGWPIPSTY